MNMDPSMNEVASALLFLLSYFHNGIGCVAFVCLKMEKNN